MYVGRVHRGVHAAPIAYRTVRAQLEEARGDTQLEEARGDFDLKV
jgi:hypothetical protein